MAKAKPKKLSELERLKAVLEAIPGYVSWIDSDLKYLGANSKLAESLGLDNKEIVGKKVGFNSKNKAFNKFIKSYFESDSEDFDSQMQLSAEQGENKWFLLVGHKYNHDNEAVLLSFDISNLKEKEEIIEAQQKRLISATKMSELGEMASGIAHEINTPLSVILGNVEILEDLAKNGVTDRATIQKFCEKIKTPPKNQ